LIFSHPSGKGPPTPENIRNPKIIENIVTKIKTAYPTDDALRKIIYLATVEAAKKWNMLG
jgi:transposase-like protein